MSDAAAAALAAHRDRLRTFEAAQATCRERLAALAVRWAGAALREHPGLRALLVLGYQGDDDRAALLACVGPELARAWRAGRLDEREGPCPVNEVTPEAAAALRADLLRLAGALLPRDSTGVGWLALFVRDPRAPGGVRLERHHHLFDR